MQGGKKVEFHEEREQREQGVEVLPVTEDAERLALSGFPLTIAYPVRTRKAPFIFILPTSDRAYEFTGLSSYS